MRLTAAILIGTALALAAGQSLANGTSDQQTADESPLVLFGEREYNSNCATCHNIGGKGYGPYLQHLIDGEYVVPALPDLTTLKSRNGGVFPTEQVRAVIDGRTEVKAHGPRDMPVWGREYGREAGEYYYEIFKVSDAEALIRERIDALIAYLKSIQEP